METNTYTYDEAYSAALSYFGGNDLVAHEWVGKYALRDSSGNILEAVPSDMHWRIATELARIEAKYPNPLSVKQIFELLDQFRYVVPTGSIMAATGDHCHLTLLTLAFAVSVQGDADSFGAIMKDNEEQLQLMKRGARVGIDLSRIRPKGLPVSNSDSVSGGVLPVVRRLELSSHDACRVESEGMLMLTLSVRHPDVESVLDELTGTTHHSSLRLVLRIDDEFMDSLHSGESYRQQFPLTAETPVVSKEVDSRILWKKIMHCVGRNVGLTLLFDSNASQINLADNYADYGFQTVSTSHDGLLLLSAYDACPQLFINIFAYVEHPYSAEAHFNFDLFIEHVRRAQRMVDDFVDIELEKVDNILSKIASDPQIDETKLTERRLWEKIAENTAASRKCALQIACMSETLSALGLDGRSREAIDFATHVQRTLALEAYCVSVELAAERGSFKYYDASREFSNSFIRCIKSADENLYANMASTGRRNMSCVATAVDSFEAKIFLPHSVLATAREVENSFSSSLSGMQYALSIQESLQKWSDHATGLKFSFSPSAEDVSAEKFCYDAMHSGISLITFPHSGNSGCDSCNGAAKVSSNEHTAVLNVVEHRPDVLECDVVRFQNNKEKWVAFVGLLHGEPYEIFTGLQDDDEGIVLPKTVTKGRIIKHTEPDGTKRYDFQFENKRGYKTTVEGLSEKFNKEYWNYAKLISGVLRYRMPLEHVIRLVGQLQLESEHINTWKVGVERALKKYLVDETQTPDGKFPSTGSNTPSVENESGHSE